MAHGSATSECPSIKIEIDKIDLSNLAATEEALGNLAPLIVDITKLKEFIECGGIAKILDLGDLVISNENISLYTTAILDQVANNLEFQPTLTRLISKLWGIVSGVSDTPQALASRSSALSVLVKLTLNTDLSSTFDISDIDQFNSLLDRETLKTQAAQALANLARSKAHYRSIARSFTKLTDLLDTDRPTTKEAATLALANLANFEDCSYLIIDTANPIPKLFALLEGDSLAAKTNATLALARLSNSKISHRHIIAAGGITKFIRISHRPIIAAGGITSFTLLPDTDKSFIQNTALLLANLSFSKDYHSNIREAGAIPVIINLFNTTEDQYIKEYAALALSRLAGSTKYLIYIRPAIPELIKVLNTTQSENIKKYASLALELATSSRLCFTLIANEVTTSNIDALLNLRLSDEQRQTLRERLPPVEPTKLSPPAKARTASAVATTGPRLCSPLDPTMFKS